MIYCLNCGKGIPDQSKFCTFCGTATARIDPQNPNTAIQTTDNSTPAAQQPVSPPPVQPVTPVPSQPYVNPTPQQPFVNPAPPQQQYVNPAQPVYQQQYAAPVHNAGAGKNEFYKNAGFWGAVLVFIGFFLPYVSAIDASFYYLVSDFASQQPSLYLYLIFPVCGGLLILHGLTGIFPKAVVNILKILPLLMVGLLILGASKSESSFAFMGSDIETILSNIGIGLYMILIGTILILFFRTTKVKA